MSLPVVLSHFQAAPLLAARRVGLPVVRVSPDLGRSTVEATIEPAGVRFPGGPLLAWDDVERISRSDTKCFRLERVDETDRDDERYALREIRAFSERTNWLRSLMPTAGAPTMLVSGLAMHRIKGTEPHRDTLTKIKAVAPVVGDVLDTATGLGYTAIEAARTAARVVTVEIDPAALEVARLNPWSQALFSDPKIEQIVGDIAEEVERFADESFSRIIHDPPMFGLAGDLYSGAIYRQFHRVLRQG